jgi:hypothetical protein
VFDGRCIIPPEQPFEVAPQLGSLAARRVLSRHRRDLFTEEHERLALVRGELEHHGCEIFSIVIAETAAS